MSLTRKRTRELKRLRASAEELWGQQQAVMDRANTVAREARQQLGHLTREEVSPRLREGYDNYVRPRVSDARDLAQRAGHTIERSVIPAVGTALGTALSVADIAKDTRVKAAVDRMGKAKKKVTKSGPGAGTFIALGVAAVAAIGLAYAVWQTFRADDELWVADDEEPIAAAADPSTPGNLE